MQLLPVFGFALVTSITPGPNNIMAATSGANHGILRTLPQIAGVAIGFGAMALLVGVGLALPLAAHPRIYDALRWISVAWLLFLAVQIARAGPPGDGEARGRPPLGFFGAALFQWVNPKAWLIVLGGTAAYVAPDAAVLPQVAIIATFFVASAFPSLVLWAGIGRGVRRFLRVEWRLRVFNFAMAALLVASVLPTLWGE